MSETQTPPVETLTLPRQRIEVPSNKGAVIELSPEPFGTVVDADNIPRQVVAAFEIPDTVYGEQDGSTVVCLSLEPGPKPKKTDPRLVATRMRRDESGELVAVKPRPLSADKWDTMHDDDPGYAFTTALVTTSRRGRKPTQATVSFTPRRFYSAKELPDPASLLHPSEDRKKNLPAILVHSSLDTKVVDENTMLSISKAAHKERSKHNRNRRLAKVAAWLGLSAAGGGAAVGTAATGGFYDKALDLQHSAGDFVDRTFEGDSPEEQAAIDRVAQTMQDLDVGNMDAIMQRDAENRERYGDDLISNEQLASFRERIAQAQTHEEAIDIASEFLGLYDKGQVNFVRTVGYEDGPPSVIAPFNEETPLRNIKSSMLGIMSALSLFPRTVAAEEFYFQGIEFGSTTSGQRAGEHLSYGSGRIGGIRLAIPTTDQDDRTIHDQVARAFLHELSHSQRGGERHSGTNQGSTADEFFWDDFWNTPEHPSLYAAAKPEHERDPEIFATLFAPGQENRFASPDAVRRFESPLGADYMRELIWWEERVPGITDHLMVTNGPGVKSPGYTAWININ